MLRSLSILNDLILVQDDIDTTRIPQAAGKTIKVRGFQQTFQRSADELLAGVKVGLQSTGVKTLVVTGHSLGAALATMTRAIIKGAVDPSVEVVITTFALPRAGNKSWADFLDSEVRPESLPSPADDPVPVLPPMFLGFTQPSGEVHVVDGAEERFVACPGQDNVHCVTGNSPFQFSAADHFGERYVGCA
ncbi:Alpha/Beta hydrolase protein [Mycena galericulata]|nr:Alpha/Beta hydrolase protein [Mycena galericulata]